MVFMRYSSSSCQLRQGGRRHSVLHGVGLSLYTARSARRELAVALAIDDALLWLCIPCLQESGFFSDPQKIRWVEKAVHGVLVLCIHRSAVGDNGNRRGGGVRPGTYRHV
eukprot:5372877-Prymnesium_polylepis.2